MKKMGKAVAFWMITALVISFVRAGEGDAANSPAAAKSDPPCVIDEGGNVVIGNVEDFLSRFDTDSNGLLSADEQKALFLVVRQRHCASCPLKPETNAPRGKKRHVHACSDCGCEPCRCVPCDRGFQKGTQGPRPGMKGCLCRQKCDCRRCDCGQHPHKGPGFQKGAQGPRPGMKGCPCGQKCDCHRCDCGHHPRKGPGFQKGGNGSLSGMKGHPWEKRRDHVSCACPQGPPSDGEAPPLEEKTPKSDETTGTADGAEVAAPEENSPVDDTAAAVEEAPTDEGASGGEESPSDEGQAREDIQKEG